jgi:hypothetical protein
MHPFWVITILTKNLNVFEALSRRVIRFLAGSHVREKASADRVPDVPLQEPTRLERLRCESELLDFAARGHPLEIRVGCPPRAANQSQHPLPQKRGEFGKTCAKSDVRCLFTECKAVP